MRIIATLLFGLLYFNTIAQTHPALERFLSTSYMRGASVSFMIKDVRNDTALYRYDANREVIPASVLKLVTTATALEFFGENFRFETAIAYDGGIKDSTLFGNIYIIGSGDPTLGSSETGRDSDETIREWVAAIKKSGIRTITGSVIADESIFDLEGVSMKWMREDLGSYYGKGSYGLNIFDNRYTLYLKTEAPESRPVILKTEPEIPSLLFHNYLITSKTDRDSSYIIGMPYANVRSLYGVVPPYRKEFQLKGDIPEPALFLAQYLTKQLEKSSVTVGDAPANYRLLSANNFLNNRERKILIVTYSPSLQEIVQITNHVSHNLYADVLLKTIGLKLRTKEEESSVKGRSEEAISSFDKGVKMLKQHWEEKGLNTSSLWMYDGCGLATADKLTASFLCDLLSYMYTQSTVSGSFIESLPRAGVEGTVANTLRGSRLQEITRLKSGSMSRVRSYAGYVTQDSRVYTVAILVNNFSCTQTQMRMDIERLLLSLFQ